MPLIVGERTRHETRGLGTLLAIQPDGLAVVDFLQGGLLRVRASELEGLDPLSERLEGGPYDPPLETVTRLLAFAIQSVQQTWGVFSRSRIQLLPHQLWVCRKVLESWPPRWMVADDVGLGKTIEAGLVMKALQARGRLDRLLVLCPASLVQQWQLRLRTMFGIQTTPYNRQMDQPTSGFWDQQRMVVASIHTLRDDRQGRHQRLLESPSWDLVVVDEAHHLGAKEREDTLAYRLVRKLAEADRVKGMLFFTGTPHKGVDYGFLALMELLRKDLFDTEKPLGDQLELLPKAMIRNSKTSATDLNGNRLFHGTVLLDHTFTYSDAEQAFYDRLTAFIQEGLLYGQQLGSDVGGAVGLVLIVLQKLAASSVAAVRRALQRRLDSLLDNQKRLERLQEAKAILSRYEDSEDNPDSRSAIDELEWDMALLEGKINLVKNEVPFLEELISLANMVPDETKLRAILDLLGKPVAEGGLEGRAVLFFTEYKATQSLLMSLLMTKFGDASTGFINGDERAVGVRLADGRVVDPSEPREDASKKFNKGIYRFLVSTEAAGEGVDLQAKCHTLIHVDMPWNPMRMHQRVGRLYRYGQTERVEVHTFRNPGTVESRIHELLREKLKLISEAFAAVAEEPEDLLQVVLGMVEPGFYDELAKRAACAEPVEQLQKWIDSGFGGDGIVATAKQLIGHVAQFDFQGVGEDLPRVDLPDLKPFFKAALALNGRDWMEDPEGRGTFITPDAWLGEYGIVGRYERMLFARGQTEQHETLGADHRIFRKAITWAIGRVEAVAAAPARLWDGPPLFVYRITEQLDPATAGPDVVIGLKLDGKGFTLLKDWEVVKALAPLADASRRLRQMEPVRPVTVPLDLFDRGIEFLQQCQVCRGATFRQPKIECLGALLPEDET